MNLLLLAAQAGAMDGTGMLVFMVLLLVVMWFFMIRPQQKKQKEIRKFQNSLQDGAKVIVSGGIQVDKNYLFADAASQGTNA